MCVGYVTHFPERPELETAGWLPRLSLEDLVFCDRWGHAGAEARPDLHDAIRAEAAGQIGTGR